MAQSVESACSAGDLGSFPWVRKIPWRRRWQPTPVFLPGEFHGQRSLVDYCSWGHKESDSEFFNVGVNSDLRFAFVDKSGLRIYEAGSSVE